jgi:anti-sigma regulatory factor (Ser/Thr protein kinase)
VSSLGPVTNGRYSHDLLLHSSDDELIEGTVAFVEQGLASGGHVLVHSSERKVPKLREALGSHPRLEYGLDEELYQAPVKTLFAYQRKLADTHGDVWVTGTVPYGDDLSGHAAWARYESLVNEALGAYAFHALCTYDLRALPESTIAAAKATHPCVSDGQHRSPSADYLDPADFLTDPLASVPEPPALRPVLSMTLLGVQDLSTARQLVRRSGVSFSAVARDVIEGFLTAVNEVLVNALRHGAPPVRLALWVEPTRLTCRVTDAGRGIHDPLAGFRYPEPTHPSGLWVARQLCDDLFIHDVPGGGCSVLMIAD